VPRGPPTVASTTSNPTKRARPFRLVGHQPLRRSIAGEVACETLADRCAGPPAAVARTRERIDHDPLSCVVISTLAKPSHLICIAVSSRSSICKPAEASSDPGASDRGAFGSDAVRRRSGWRLQRL
jgi:hypothetical protein